MFNMTAWTISKQIFTLFFHFFLSFSFWDVRENIYSMYGDRCKPFMRFYFNKNINNTFTFGCTCVWCHTFILFKFVLLHNQKIMNALAHIGFYPM